MSESTASLLSRSQVSRRLRETFVVDMDVHISDSPEALAQHCIEPWRTALQHIASLPQRYLDVPGFAPNLVPFPFFPGPERKHRLGTPAETRADLDDLGIDLGVLFPDALLLHAVIQQREYAVALAQAYNRWLLAEWLQDDHGLLGAIVSPHHDPIAGAEEIRRYAGHPRVRAVYLPTSCVEPLYGDRRYDPVYDAAQEAGLPVVLHAVSMVHPRFPFNVDQFQSIFGQHTIAHGFAMIANLVHMIESGVPVRFPRLRIAFTEAGIAWVPWIMLRMDKEYLERRRDVPLLREPPSHYVRQMFFATQPIEEPERMGDMATLMSLFGGEDQVVFASDWPHHDFDHPSKVLQIPLGAEGTAKVMGLNALRLLGMERPAPAPAGGSAQ